MDPRLRIMPVRRVSSWFAAAACAAAAACSSPTSPDGAFHTEVTLRPGQVQAVASTPLRVGFERVDADSRCPSTALCIQSGDALVVVRVTVDGSNGAELTLRTRGGASSDRLTASIAGYELSIGGLQPYPETTTPIPPGDYRVTLVISRD
jgi:hypothetical protein